MNVDIVLDGGESSSEEETKQISEYEKEIQKNVALRNKKFEELVSVARKDFIDVIASTLSTDKQTRPKERKRKKDRYKLLYSRYNLAKY